MKKNLKSFVSILSVCALLFTSLPTVQLFPSATVSTETVTIDFEGEENKFVSDVYDDHAHEFANLNFTSNVSSPVAIDGEGNTNNVLKILRPTKLTGVGTGNLTEFVSPDKTVIEDRKTAGKYITSGSFKVALSGTYNLCTAIFAFGYGAENYQIVNYGWNVNNFLEGNSFTVSKSNENTNIKLNNHLKQFYSHSTYGQNYMNQKWVDVNFSFDDNNKLSLTVKHGDISHTRSSLLTIAPEDRILGFAVAAYNGGNNLDMYIDDVKLNFEWKEETEIETLRYDFQDGKGFVNNAFDDDYAHANATLTFMDQYSNNLFGMWNIYGNKLGYMYKFAATEGATRTEGNMTEFISPARSVFDNLKNANKPKYLVSGSFEMYFSRVNSIHNAFVFGMDETNYQYAILRLNSDTTLSSTAFSQLRTEEATNTWADAEDQYKYSGLSDVNVNDWCHVEFYFDTDNKLHIEVSDSADNSAEWTYENITVAPQDRIFAFVSPYCSTAKDIMFDNVLLNFTHEDKMSKYSEYPNDIYARVMDFAEGQYVKETFELDPEKIVPYDFERINKVNTKYKYFLARDPELLAQEQFDDFRTKLPALIETVEKWGDVSAPEKTAESFYNLYLKENIVYKEAYNIYRRLLSEERNAFKTAYPSKYAEMMYNIKNSGNSNDAQINIVAAGDSITQGTDSIGYWTNELQTLLNANSAETTYNVYNHGYSGRCILGNFGLKFDSSQRDGDYRSTDKYYASISHEDTDVVIIMLGTNDADRVDFAETDSDGNIVFKKGRYEQFWDVYSDLIQSYLALESNPHIIIASNPRLANHDKSTQFDARFNENVAALKILFEDLANEYELEYIDINQYTNDNLNPDLTANGGDYLDRLHPNVNGSKKIAEHHYENLNTYVIKDLNDALIMYKNNIKGDSNVDGECNIADLLRVKKYIVDNSVEISIKNGDFNSSNSINDIDFEMLCQYILVN